MASGLIVDPTTLLRVAPLVTSTCSAYYCWDQYLFLHLFLRPGVRQKSEEILPGTGGYFQSFFDKGLWAIFGLYGLSIGTGIANVVSRRPAASPLYLAGVCFSAAHFLFVPFVMPMIRDIVYDEKKGKSTDDLGKWLYVHSIRSLLVDLPGWVCFALATMHAVTVV